MTTTRPEASATPRIDTSAAGTPEGRWRDALADLPALARAPVAGRAVVVAPHPDDETLGVGGLVADLCAAGWRVVVVAVTAGEAADAADPALAGRRLAEQRTALDVVGAGCAAIEVLGLPDGRVTEHADELEALLRPLVTASDLCVATWEHDGHPDHDAVGRSTRRLATELDVPLLQFPVWAWHWATPDVLPLHRARRWELSPVRAAAKRQALDAFSSQRSGPDPILPVHVVARFLRPYEVLIT